jgi:hypothetical protein
MSTRTSATTPLTRRHARKPGAGLAACALIAVGLLAGCTPHATDPLGPAPARSSAPAAAPTVPARVFVSPHYGYSVALPAGWSALGAQPSHGPSSSGPASPGRGKDGVDVFRGSPFVTAWAFAAPKPASLAGYATATARAAAQLPCPAKPQIDQQVTIGGAAASLIGMSCPTQGGVFMLTAATTHKQSALIFVFEDSSGIKAAQSADRVAFRELLAGIRFRG